MTGARHTVAIKARRAGCTFAAEQAAYQSGRTDALEEAIAAVRAAAADYRSPVTVELLGAQAAVALAHAADMLAIRLIALHAVSAA